MIYQYAATDSFDQHEIHITYPLDDPIHQGKLGTLQSPCLAVLDKLRRVSAGVFLGAIEYFTGPLFYRAFVSKLQSYKYLLQAILRCVDKRILARYHHVCLARFSLWEHQVPAHLVSNRVQDSWSHAPDYLKKHSV